MLTACEPSAWESASAEVREGYFEAHRAFERAVAAAGSTMTGAALADADTATTVRHDADGALSVTDGPFVELVEQIGGFYLVDLPDLDAAVAAAAMLPASYAVEIRPVIEIEGYEPP